MVTDIINVCARLLVAVDGSGEVGKSQTCREFSIMVRSLELLLDMRRHGEGKVKR